MNELFQNHSLRDVLKTENDRLKDLVHKYKEIRVQTQKHRPVTTQYITSHTGGSPTHTAQTSWVQIVWQGKEQIYNRYRIKSNTRRQDSQRRHYIK